MGYFADAQYDVLFLYVILNEVKNPTEELTGHILFTWVVGYFAYAQYDVKSPIVGVADTSPEGGSQLPSLRGSEATKQSPGRVEVYGV